MATKIGGHCVCGKDITDQDNRGEGVRVIIREKNLDIEYCSVACMVASIKKLVRGAG